MVKLIDKLTIGMFQDIHALPDDMNEVTKGVHIISTIEGISHDEVRKWKTPKFKQYLTMYTTIDFSVYEKGFVSSLMIESKKHKIVYKMNDLEAGQLIDMIETMKTSDQPISYMNRALAILCLKGKNYTSENIDILSERIRGVLLKEVWGVWVFFFNLWIRFCTVSEDYLSDQMTKSLKEAERLLLSRSGAGS